jgi:hypothetical protein
LSKKSIALEFAAARFYMQIKSLKRPLFVASATGARGVSSGDVIRDWLKGPKRHPKLAISPLRFRDYLDHEEITNQTLVQQISAMLSECR